MPNADNKDYSVQIIKRLKHKSTQCYFIHFVLGSYWHQEWKTTVERTVLTGIHRVNKVMVTLNRVQTVLTTSCLAGKKSAAGRGKVLLHCIGEWYYLQWAYSRISPALSCGPYNYFQLCYRETEFLLGANKVP